MDMKWSGGFLSFKNVLLGLLLLGAIFVALNFTQASSFAQQQFSQYLTYSICDKPLSYKIGTVDPQFGLSQSDFKWDADQAAQIWNDAYGKRLFAPNASDPRAVTINLVYDARSSLNSQVNELEGQLKQKDQSLSSQISEYERNVSDFKKRLADFYARADTLNSQIRDWNRRGGAPQEVHDQLVKEQQSLQLEQEVLKKESDSLNQTARNLNLSTQDYNTSVKDLNSSINTFNEELAKKPEEGVYDGRTNQIDIYFNNDRNELIHTLSHELGHALTIPHNTNDQSIMYPYSSKNIALTTEDIASLQSVCSVRHLNIPFLGNFTYIR